MLKMALFDSAINEKCCSVDGGRGICPIFSLLPGGQPGGGGGWAQVELIDT